MSQEDIAITLATYEAQQDMKLKAKEMEFNLERFGAQASNMGYNGERIRAAVSNFVANGTFGTDLTQDELVYLQHLYQTGNIATLLGYDNMNSMQLESGLWTDSQQGQMEKDALTNLKETKAITSNISFVDEIAEDIFNEIIKANDNLTIQQSQQVADILDQAYIKAGSFGSGALGNVLKGLKDDQIGEFLNIFSGADWENMSLTEIVELFNKNESGMEFTVHQFRDLYDSMKNGGKSVKTLADSIGALVEKAKKLTTGDTIDEEEYLKYAELGMSEYFTMMHDGTYQLTKDARELYGVIREQTNDELDKAIEIKAQTITENEEIKKKYENDKGKYDEYLKTTKIPTLPQRFEDTEFMYSNGQITYVPDRERRTWNSSEELIQAVFPDLEYKKWGESNLNYGRDSYITETTEDAYGNPIIIPLNNKFTEDSIKSIEEKVHWYYVNPIDKNFAAYTTENVYTLNKEALMNKYENDQNVAKEITDEQLTEYIKNNLQFLHNYKGIASNYSKYIDEDEKGNFIYKNLDELVQSQKAYDDFNDYVENLKTELINADPKIRKAKQEINAARKAILSTANSHQEIEDLAKKYNIGDEITSQRKQEIDEINRLNDIATEERLKLENTLYSMYKEDGYSSKLIENMAEDYLRLQQGQNNLLSNFDKWEQGLKQEKGTIQYFESLQGFKESIADLLDVSEEIVTEGFLTPEHLNLVEKAINGDNEALKKLRKELLKIPQENILSDIDPSKANEFKNILNNMFEGKDNPFAEALSEVTSLSELLDSISDTELTVGCTIQNSEQLKAKGQLLLALGASPYNVAKYFEGMGFSDVNIIAANKQVTIQGNGAVNGLSVEGTLMAALGTKELDREALQTTYGYESSETLEKDIASGVLTKKVLKQKGWEQGNTAVGAKSYLYLDEAGFLQISSEDLPGFNTHYDKTQYIITSGGYTDPNVGKGKTTETKISEGFNRN